MCSYYVAPLQGVLFLAHTNLLKGKTNQIILEMEKHKCSFVFQTYAELLRFLQIYFE